MYLKPSLWIDKAAKNELPMENINRKYHWTTRERQRYSQYDLNIEPFSKTKHLSHIKIVSSYSDSDSSLNSTCKFLSTMIIMKGISKEIFAHWGLKISMDHTTPCRAEWMCWGGDKLFVHRERKEKKIMSSISLQKPSCWAVALQW